MLLNFDSTFLYEVQGELLNRFIDAQTVLTIS